MSVNQTGSYSRFFPRFLPSSYRWRRWAGRSKALAHKPIYPIWGPNPPAGHTDALRSATDLVAAWRPRCVLLWELWDRRMAPKRSTPVPEQRKPAAGDHSPTASLCRMSLRRQYLRTDSLRAAHPGDLRRGKI